MKKLAWHRWPSAITLAHPEYDGRTICMNLPWEGDGRDYYDIVTLMMLSNFDWQSLPWSATASAPPRQLLNCVAGHRQMKWAPFPNAVARVCGVPLQEQPRC
jgi:hypothetical protein